MSQGLSAWEDGHPMYTRPLVVKLSGEFDVQRRDELDETLAAVADASLVVLDLSECRSVDSSFLGSLARLRRNRRRNVLHMRLVVRSALVRHCLDMAGFCAIWPAHETVSSAIASLANVIRAEYATASEGADSRRPA
jgi:anti-anti-sigma factor